MDSNYCKNNERSVIASLKNIGIYRGGYTDLDIKYLQALSKLKTASLLTLSRNLGIDKNTLVNEIEPFLLDRGHIELTRSGRKFISFQEKEYVR
jgi:Holliday junction resolvasome RuvABC ATP-dependent DNA helicase subunit